MMKCCSKEQIDRTGRATKTSMDLSHVCPSKLSKKELEEFYYALLQENLEMKKSFNKQNEQLKILSTKLQRMMTTQRTYMANEPKDCCSSTKAMVQDQKKTIADLKKANDNLKLEIKNLNMKLCSARQFLKRSSQGPYQMQNKSVSRPTSSIVGPTDSTRNSSTSALNLKKPEIVDDQMKSVSCQCLVKLGLPSGDIEKLCDENRCRTQMDELKQKIVNLQEELHKTHEEYAKRISKLEHEVTDLQEENARVRNERAATDVTLDKRVSEVNDMKKKLRDTQTECEFLNTELTIEKGKVAELEAQVKAAAIGTPLLKAIEYRLSKDPTNNKLKDDASSLAVKDTKRDSGKLAEDGTRTYPKHKCSATDPDSYLNNDLSRTSSIKKDRSSSAMRNSRLPSAFLNEPSSSKRNLDESTSAPVEKPEKKTSSVKTLEFIPEVPEQAEASPTTEDGLTSKHKESKPKVYYRDSTMPLGVPIADSNSKTENKEDSGGESSFPTELADQPSYKNADSVDTVKSGNKKAPNGNGCSPPTQAKGQPSAKGQRNESCARCEAIKKKKVDTLGDSDAKREVCEVVDPPLIWTNEPNNEKLSLDPRSAAGTTPTKKADDSGYGEANQSNDNDDKEAMQKLNQELMDQIADLQRQLSELKTRMLSNSDTYTIESDDALKDSGDTNATSGPKNGDLKPRDKKETDKDLKDVNQRLYDGDPSNADCEKICRLETNQDCSDNCLNKPSNESGNKPKTPNNFENEPDSKEYQPLNTNNESKNIRESRNKDNDNKYQIPGPIPVTSTPVGRKPDVTYAMLTKRDNDTESLNLPKIEDSLVINRENIIHKRLENKEEIPTTLRLRNKIKEATEKHKSSLAKDTFYYNDPAGNEQLLASNLQNEAQTLKKSPPDVSSQNVEENYPNDQRLNQFSQEKPQHDHNKPQHEKTAPVSKRTPSHIHDIIQSLYARFAKKTSSQAQTEGISANGQNIEDPQTTGTAPKLEDTPPKVETNIGPHKCTCKMENPDSVARNTTPKIADCPKCCKELTAEMTSNDTEGPKCCKNPTSAPLTDNPANEIIKPPNTDNTTVTFDKNYEDDNKSLALNDYLNNQNSDPDRIKNDVGSQDGPEYQGNQSRRKSSAGMQVPVLERKFDDVGATRAPPPPEKDEAVVLLPPMRPPSSSYQGLVDDTYIQPKDEHTQLSKEDKAIDNQLDICEHMTHVCTCPQESPAVVGPARKDVAVFRTCSGTLRFRTTDTPTSHIRKCRCSGKSKHPHCGAPEGQTVDSVTHTHNEEGVQAIEHPWNGNTSAPRTYTINAFAELVKCSRATSPENTDQEISSMTDLPSEKDTTSSPRCKKCETWTSPGEDKATTTTTSHSHTMPTAYSLSEGELPQLDKPTRDQCSEAAYAPKSVRKISAKNNLLENSSSAQMEAALQAIGNELARCRQLLLQSREPEEIPTNQNSKPVPKPVKEASVMAGASSPHLPASPPPSLASTLPLRLTESPPQSITSTLPFDPSPLPPPHVSRPIQDFIPSPPPPALYPMLETKQGSIISLRKTEARPRIGDAYTPRAMFTLHIGTVVLSDEAVINSRDLSLVLTWQFYDQNVAMSRMRSGRVVHFDFSTEYDLKLTDTFLNYLKADELHIKICEVNKLDETLASCSLPLREALLHTNRRVDMSLALVAGPQMRWSPPTADALDSGDEMGVLDLWCMLRAEPRLLPRINKAIAHTRASSSPGGRHLPSSGAIMMQINEDDQDDIRLSGDLSFNPTSTRNSMVGPVQDDRRNSKADKGVQTQDIDTRRNDSGQEKRSNFGYRDSSQPFPPYPGASDMGNIKPGEKLSAEINSTDIKHPPNSMEELKNQVSFENRWNAFESRRRSSGIIINEVPANVTTSTKMKEALEKNLRKPAIEEYDVDEKRDSGQLSIKSLVRRPKNMSMEKRDLLSMATRASGNSFDDFLNNTNYDDKNIIKRSDMEPTRERHTSDTTELSRKYDNMSKMMGAKKAMEAFKRVKIKKDESFIAPTTQENYDKPTDYLDRIRSQSIDITILWLALNEECAAMGDPGVQRLYVAYTFIGRGGAELETPLSLPKPKQSQDKCYFNFKKSFQLKESDLPILGRMAKCRSPNKGPPDANDCVVFTVVSEPVEDPLGLNNCEDIGNAHLFFGDLLAYSAGSDTYTEVIPVRGTRLDDVCGVLAIRVDGLDVVRKCLMLASVSEQRQPFVSFW